MFDSLSDRTLLIIVFMFMTIVATMIMAVYLQTRRQEFQLRYDHELRRAKVSDERDWFEMRIAELNSRLMASENRWKDVNHLVVSGANLQKNDSRPQTVLGQFLINMGISKEDLAVNDELVFVLTPFSESELSTFVAIKNICSTIGLKAIRGDESFTAGDILAHVVQNMVKARIVIANITARNPNVFYELGIAHALSKPTILISETIKEVPFDVQSQRIVLFSDLEELERELTKALARALSRPDPLAKVTSLKRVRRIDFDETDQSP